MLHAETNRMLCLEYSHADLNRECSRPTSLDSTNWKPKSPAPTVYTKQERFFFLATSKQHILATTHIALTVD